MERQGKAVLTADELSVFCGQLARLFRAGIGSEEAAEILAECGESSGERERFTRIQSAMAEGKFLSQALEDAGGFPAYLVRMVAIGENAGRLDQVMDALSAYYRRESAVSSAVRRAVVYPAAMAILVALVFLLLISRVLPVFQRVFDQLGVAPSPLARGLLQAGEVGKYIGGALLLVMAVGGVWLLVRSRSGSVAWESAFLARTRAGSAVDRSRFISAMALMLSSGLPQEESMEKAVALLEGTALSEKLAACAKELAAGEDFAKAAQSCGVLNGVQAGLLRVGYRSGTAEQTMEELSERCREEADSALGALLDRLELTLVVALCAGVGLVLLSVMLPLLGVLSAIG